MLKELLEPEHRGRPKFGQKCRLRHPFEPPCRAETARGRQLRARRSGGGCAPCPRLRVRSAPTADQDPSASRKHPPEFALRCCPRRSSGNSAPEDGTDGGNRRPKSPPYLGGRPPRSGFQNNPQCSRTH